MRVVLCLPLVFGLVAAVACSSSSPKTHEPTRSDDAGADVDMDLDVGGPSPDAGDASGRDAGDLTPADGGQDEGDPKADAGMTDAGMTDAGMIEPEIPCTPWTCETWRAQEAIECGELNDRCGSALNCGCPAQLTCLSDHRCGCEAESDEALCAAADGCGSLTFTDRCGSERSIFCEGCASGLACDVSSRTCVGLTDARDGKIYPVVRIGEQIWMARNLAYALEGSYCYVAPSDEACFRFGRYYSWWQAVADDNSEGSAANPSGLRGVCPEGWHLPSKAEYVQLANYILNDQNMDGDASSGTSEIAQHLKIFSEWGGPLVWENKDESYNTYGFALLPAGKRLSGDQVALELNREAMLVTATKDARHYVAYSGYNSFTSFSSFLSYASVRCVRD